MPEQDTDAAAETVRVSRIDDKDRHDIRLQRIIDDLARRAEGHPHPAVTAELAERITAANLPPMPQPWLDAVAAAAITGDAYVVSATSAAVSDVPPPATKTLQEDIT